VLFIAGCLFLIFFAQSVFAQAAPVIDLSVSPASTTTNVPVTLSTVIEPNGNALGGLVTFYDCGTRLGTANVTSATTTNYVPYSDNLTQGWTDKGGTAPVTVAGPNGLFQASEVNNPTFWQMANVPDSTRAPFLALSFWMRTTTGTFRALTILPGGDHQYFTVGPVWQRYSFTFSNPGNPGNNVKLWFNADYDPNETVDVGGFQLEAASVAGPYVSTTSGPATGTGGIASFTTTGTLAQGAHAFTASYGTGWSEAAQAWVGAAPSFTLTSSSSSSTKVSGNPEPVSAYGQAVTFTATLTGAADGTWITFWDGNSMLGTDQTSGGQATFSTSALTVGTHTIGATYDAANVGVQIYQVVVATTGSPLVVTTTILPGGTPGAAYSATLAAAGGSGAYTWSVLPGSLPAGLSLNSNTGVISGMLPSTPGSSNFTVQVTDMLPNTASQTLILNSYPPVTVSAATLPGGVSGSAYSVTLTATGGSGKYTWSLVSSSLPTGLQLSANSGVISGTLVAGGGTIGSP